MFNQHHGNTQESPACGDGSCKITKTETAATFAHFVAKILGLTPESANPQTPAKIPPKDANDPISVLNKFGLLKTENKCLPETDAKKSAVDISFYREESQLGGVTRLFSSNHRFQKGKLVYASTKQVAPEVCADVSGFQRWWTKIGNGKRPTGKEEGKIQVDRTILANKSPSTRRSLLDLFKELKREEIIRRYEASSRKTRRLVRPPSPILEIPYRSQYKADEQDDLREMALRRYFEKYRPERVEDLLKEAREDNARGRCRTTLQKTTTVTAMRKRQKRPPEARTRELGWRQKLFGVQNVMPGGIVATWRQNERTHRNIGVKTVEVDRGVRRSRYTLGSKVVPERGTEEKFEIGDQVPRIKFKDIIPIPEFKRFQPSTKAKLEKIERSEEVEDEDSTVSASASQRYVSDSNASVGTFQFGKGDSKTSICTVFGNDPTPDVLPKKRKSSTRRNLVQVKLQEDDRRDFRKSHSEKARARMRELYSEELQSRNQLPKDATTERKPQPRRQSTVKPPVEPTKQRGKKRFLYPHLFHQEKFHRNSKDLNGIPNNHSQVDKGRRNSVDARDPRKSSVQYVALKRASKNPLALVVAQGSGSFIVDADRAKLDLERLVNRESLEEYKRKYSEAALNQLDRKNSKTAPESHGLFHNPESHTNPKNHRHKNFNGASSEERSTSRGMAAANHDSHGESPGREFCAACV